MTGATDATEVKQDSPLLRDMSSWRARKLAAAHVDLKVLHSDNDGDPAIYVRYGVVDSDTLESAIDRSSAADSSDERLNTDIDVLIHGCQGIFIKTKGGDRVGLDGSKSAAEWPRFDALAPLFGLPEKTPVRDQVRHLFLAEQDIKAHAARIGVFSGMKAAEVDEDLAGK